ncbi:PLP-dependent transferase [Acaromyces ingoldii]|uniref:PLP-dependent transferase n=1 Tax=Acaromyces ingoldii TaxID=215250 RepID=A0A316YN77_9BASI|nr:PLP-dependent transferase [Acaromyces ingoldii]PWN90602.1 PLP-dependent transferase [Acaromyces ingoldii]
MEAYGQHIGEVRRREFASQHLDSSTFLDAASHPPAPLSALDAVHLHLTREGGPISNPHSGSPSGTRTRQRIDEVRELVCREIFGLDRTGGPWRPLDGIADSSNNERGWELIFTSGATASLELVARSFDFGSGDGKGTFGYLEEAHSSLVGLRDIVTGERSDRGAKCAQPLKADSAQIEAFINGAATSSSPSLLALPLQCNATGKRFNGLVASSLLQRRGAHPPRPYILLDAASYLSPSMRLPMRESFSHDSQDESMPDFVAFSFYKLLGSPTGLGGLLVKRSSAARALLASNGKQYFGGGAVSALMASAAWREPARELHAALEDGTGNLHAILSVPTMLQTLRSSSLLGSWSESGAYVDDLTRHLWSSLSSLRHGDGSSVCRMYSPAPRGCGHILSSPQSSPSTASLSSTPTSSASASASLNQGPIVLFNVCRPASAVQDDNALSQSLLIDPNEVDRLASVSDIHLRCGRMCNAGAIANALGLAENAFQKLWHLGVGCGMAGWVQGAGDSQVSSALRVSVCAWNTRGDIDRLVEFLQRFFAIDGCAPTKVEDNEQDVYLSCEDDDEDDERGSASETASQQTDSTSQTSSLGRQRKEHEQRCLRLSSVHLFPIKSCAGQVIDIPWRLKPTGLEYDRQFCVIDLTNGRVMSQKRVKALARIRPSIDLSSRTMTVEFISHDGVSRVPSPIHVHLEEEDGGKELDVDFCDDGSIVRPVLLSCHEVQRRFSEFLGRRCTLARMDRSRLRMDRLPLLLSNESPFLVINQRSVEEVCKWIEQDEGIYMDPERVALCFRSNFVIDGGLDQAFDEDTARRVVVGRSIFAVMGPCRRCEMIALDQVNGRPVPQVLKAVASHRRYTGGALSGRILFGAHLTWIQKSCSQSEWIQVGMPVFLQ